MKLKFETIEVIGLKIGARETLTKFYGLLYKIKNIIEDGNRGC